MYRFDLIVREAPLIACRSWFPIVVSVIVPDVMSCDYTLPFEYECRCLYLHLFTFTNNRESSGVSRLDQFRSISDLSLSTGPFTSADKTLAIEYICMS
jgi:hypothetical protein